LLAIMNDILDITQIEAQRVELEESLIDISLFIKELAITVRPLVTRNGNKFEIEQGDDLGVTWSDAPKLQKILANLLSNAGKFTQQGLITLRVDKQTAVSSSQSDPSEQLIFQVLDTGIGMEFEAIANVFQPFSQADPSMTRQYGGTGLGLAIAYRLCQIMNGSLIVESEPNEGTIFTVSLPVKNEVVSSELRDI